MESHLYLRNFIKKDKQKKDKTYPLMVVLYTPECKVSLSVKCSVKLSEWNPVTALPSGNAEAMKKIKQIRKQLLSIYQIHKIQGENLTAKEVKSIYVSRNYKPMDIITNYFQKVNRTTILQQKFLLAFKQFLRRKYRLYSIDYSYLPITLWQDFKVYFQKYFYKKQYRSCLYFIGKQLLKFPLKLAITVGIKNDLNSFKSVLTTLEINRIIDYPFTKRLSKIRNGFLMALHTGLSFDVIKNLTRNNLRKISTGEDYLLVRNQSGKTQWIDIGALPKIIQNNCLHSKTSLLFPMPSIQKTNAYLKEIAEYCTDAKWLTFTTAVFHYRNTM